jgi:hypothetical protein
MKIKQLLEKIKDAWSYEILPKANLRKKFPDYFNMYILRTAWVMLAALIIFEFFANGNSFVATYVSCPADALGGQCMNPFYDCANINISEMKFGYPTSCSADPPLCDDDMCNRPYLQAGESYGRKGAGAFEVFLIVGGAFLINHLYYKIKTRKHGEKR